MAVELTIYLRKCCPNHKQLLTQIIVRYDFEANKKNNLIFYGLPAEPRETPSLLINKVKQLILKFILGHDCAEDNLVDEERRGPELCVQTADGSGGGGVQVQGLGA